MHKVWHRTFDGWWYVTLTEGGTRRQIKLVKAPNDKASKAAAERLAIQELAARQPADGQPPDDRGVPSWATAGHVVRAFLAHSRAEHSAETATWYVNLLTPFAELYGKVRVARLRKRHVKAWLQSRGYNPTSQNRAVGALKRAFNWAVEEEYIPRNPVAHVRKPKAKTRDRTLTPAERALVLGAIKDAAFKAFVTAMTLTGCRPGEVARVTAADCDLAAGLWVLARHKTAKTTGKPRVVYLSPDALALTRELAAARPAGPLFLNRRGKPWTRNAVRTRFMRLRDKHPALKDVVAYTYRASFATDALEGGVPDASVAALLGHTNTATLHKFYNRLSARVGHLRDAAAKAGRGPANG
jgi:integrase